MKKLLLALFALASVVLLAADSREEIARRLYGRIKIVHSKYVEADYRVRVVKSGEDLRVRIVDSASAPGQWKIVASNWDYSIHFCEPGDDVIPDLDIRFVDCGEGLVED